MVKNPPASAENSRDAALIPGSERSPGEGNGNPLQYSCLENPVDRGARWATVHRVTKSLTQLCAHTHRGYFLASIPLWVGRDQGQSLTSIPESWHRHRNGEKAIRNVGVLGYAASERKE